MYQCILVHCDTPADGMCIVSQFLVHRGGSLRLPKIGKNDFDQVTNTKKKVFIPKMELLLPM